MEYSREILECNDHSKGKYSFYQIFVLTEYTHLYEYVYQMVIKNAFFTVGHSKKCLKKKKKTLLESLRLYLT